MGADSALIIIPFAIVAVLFFEIAAKTKVAEQSRLSEGYYRQPGN
jgi:hypothetical protein